MIIGCDLQTRYQQIAMLDLETGELVERWLEHENGEARAFYAALQGTVRVGIEATGHTHWFEAMLTGKHKTGARGGRSACSSGPWRRKRRQGGDLSQKAAEGMENRRAWE